MWNRTWCYNCSFISDTLQTHDRSLSDDLLCHFLNMFGALLCGSRRNALLSSSSTTLDILLKSVSKHDSCFITMATISRIWFDLAMREGIKFKSTNSSASGQRCSSRYQTWLLFQNNDSPECVMVHGITLDTDGYHLSYPCWGTGFKSRWTHQIRSLWKGIQHLSCPDHDPLWWPRLG